MNEPGGKIDLMRQALARCTFLPGHPNKRFARQILETDLDKITPKQERHLIRLCWRYRRQIPFDLVPSKDAIEAVDAGAAAALVTVLLLSGCSPAGVARMDAALARPSGQLFCAIQLNGGGQIVAAVATLAVSGAAPAAAPLAVVVTGATRQTIDEDCKRAAASYGAASAVPVAAPAAAPVPVVTIPSSASPAVPRSKTE